MEFMKSKHILDGNFPFGQPTRTELTSKVKTTDSKVYGKEMKLKT